MLKVDPAHRLTSKEILQHPWLRGEPNGAVTTNVLEMMKQYSLEQKQVVHAFLWDIMFRDRRQILFLICDALRDLVAFVQFKKREKYPWRGVTFSKVVG